MVIYEKLPIHHKNSILPFQNLQSFLTERAKHYICNTHDSAHRYIGTQTCPALDKEKNNILFLSPSLWPQPDASAAGVRTATLLQHFASPNNKAFDRVHYGCGLEGDPKVSFPAVKMHHIPLNRPKKFMQSIKNGVEGSLKAVVFDRFFAEEAYSFHFYNNGKQSNVLRILDMQDMHSLRYHRQTLIQTMDSVDLSSPSKLNSLDQLSKSSVLNSFPTNQWSVNQQHSSMNKNPSLVLWRELAAIHRSDLILVCSQFELELLRGEYGIDPEKMVLAPFFTESNDKFHTSTTNISEEFLEIEDINSPHSFEMRRDFVSLGGFKHPPNIDQVLVLKKVIWPRIREKLPCAKLHIYGSYPPPRIQQLHDKKTGFIVHGYVTDLEIPMGQGRILLAPIRYGAGIKGKIVDAWRYGCPVVTTPIGAEGIGYKYDKDGKQRNDNHRIYWGGEIACNNEHFINSAIELYSNKNDWLRTQSNARRLLKDLFDKDHNLSILDNSIAAAIENMHCRRKRDYTSAMLWHHTARSTEYFSRWIELKESLRND